MSRERESCKRRRDKIKGGERSESWKIEMMMEMTRTMMMTMMKKGSMRRMTISVERMRMCILTLKWREKSRMRKRRSQMAIRKPI
jgi:hypothetical protein